MLDLSQFVELIRVEPGYKYIEVTTKVDEFTKALYAHLNANGAKLRIASYLDAQNIDAQYPLASIDYIKNLNLSYRALPRDNDIVIYKDIFTTHNKPELLLKTAYTTLTNAANIIIVEKQGLLDAQKMSELFEQFEFRASSHIDILEGYDIFMAKKMHMWGNGL